MFESLEFVVRKLRICILVLLVKVQENILIFWQNEKGFARGLFVKETFKSFSSNFQENFSYYVAVEDTTISRMKYHFRVPKFLCSLLRLQISEFNDHTRLRQCSINLPKRKSSDPKMYLGILRHGLLKFFVLQCTFLVGFAVLFVMFMNGLAVWYKTIILLVYSWSSDRGTNVRSAKASRRADI